MQAPTGYTGIYSDWNIDLDNADRDFDPTTGGDDLWDFGTNRQYPALKVDFDGDGETTWWEFGDQIGNRPTPTPTPTPRPTATPHPYSYTHQHADAHADSNADARSNNNADARSNSNTDSNADARSNGNTDSNTDAYPDTYEPAHGRTDLDTGPTDQHTRSGRNAWADGSAYKHSHRN